MPPQSSGGALRATSSSGSSGPLAGDVPGIGEIGVAGAGVGDGEPVLPAIAEVVEIINPRLAWPQHIAQPHLGGVGPRFGSPVLVHRQAILALVDGELPEVAIEPPHRRLDNIV